ncbi:hypothetical protein KR222_008711 [Zaprionus bogoriensis]|nr:hypothetical protein KR222_008711 [Zaprionus bogoriensis]
MENRNAERKQDVPCKSMPNLSLLPEFESESSLNPLASEFIPSHLQSHSQSQTPAQAPAELHAKDLDQAQPHAQAQQPQAQAQAQAQVLAQSAGYIGANQYMKSEATSTTTLIPEVVGDASYLQAQRQLFELLHQLGSRFMPLKTITVSLVPDGQGINVKFTSEPSTLAKQLLDESVCQNSALHLEMGERSFMPRQLPNVLAANFMARMGDILNDKMEWSLDSGSSFSTPVNSLSKPVVGAKRFNSTSLGNDMNKVHTLSSSTQAIDTLSVRKPLELPAINQQSRPSQVSKIPAPAPAPVSGWKRMKSVISRSDMRQRPGIAAKEESQHDRKAIKGRTTPRKTLGQVIKKSAQKLAPRGTNTSLMRQSAAKKRLGLMKDESLALLKID